MGKKGPPGYKGPAPPKAKKAGEIPSFENDSEGDDNIEEQSRKRKVKQDFDMMKSTLRVENVGEFMGDEMFDYQEKVDDVLDLHDEILAMHMNILKVNLF